MNKFFIIFLLLISVFLCGLVTQAHNADGICAWLGSCDVCITRFEVFVIGDNALTRGKLNPYMLCEDCWSKFKKDGQISLHPSRYCGVWCAHSIEYSNKCPFKNKPRVIYYNE